MAKATIAHVWTGGCGQGVFSFNAALMYLVSDPVL